MKKLNKKGFTLIELVIVIAVIAILAAVLIPTFTNIIQKANESNALTTGASLYEECLALDLADGEFDGKENGLDINETKFTDIKGLTALTYEASGKVTKFEAMIGDYKVTRTFTEGVDQGTFTVAPKDGE